MGKNQNKIEKLLNDLKLEQVSGGYVGSDWNEEDASIYEKLGIRHYRNLLRKDTYYIGDIKVPKNFVYVMAHTWKKGNQKAAESWVSAIKNRELDGVSLKDYYKFLDNNFSYSEFF